MRNLSLAGQPPGVRPCSVSGSSVAVATGHTKASEEWLHVTTPKKKVGNVTEKCVDLTRLTGLHLLEKPNLPFSLVPSLYVGAPLPSLADWEALWHAWDAVTKGMLPAEEVLEKPIRLRNACIFYLGHIPTFLDIQLTRTTGGIATDPRYFWTIFERGIDPDVDNPEKCHAHSEIPEEWPTVVEIEQYQQRVRSRLRQLYGLDGAVENGLSRRVRRGMWVGFEHEAMHLETLLYMLLQSDKVLSPPLAPRPDFKRMARKAKAARVPNAWHVVPAQTITVGIDDPEHGTDVDGHFGWHVDFNFPWCQTVD
jgi:L-histidine Nalpha-methyltransferase / hercynylcysteine S-oxide synthase